MPDRFTTCLIAALQTKPNFGRKRIAEARAVYEGYRDQLVADGSPFDIASGVAQMRVLDDVNAARAARLKGFAYNTGLKTELIRRVGEAENINVLRGGDPERVVRAVVSVLGRERRISGANLSTLYDTTKGKYMMLFGDNLQRMTKGWMGTQRGKVIMEDAIRESFSVGSTGSQFAKDLAQSFSNFWKMHISDMNTTGVTLKHVAQAFPNPFTASKLNKMAKGGKLAEANAAFRDKMMQRVDWKQTTTPRGSMIPVADREAFLDKVHYAYRTGDYSEFEKPYGITNERFANTFRQDRMLVFKDADSWLTTLNEFSDMQVFDVMTRSIEKAANNYAISRMLGTNPDNMIREMRTIAQEAVARVKPGAAEELQALDKRLGVFENMSISILKHNPMDPESWLSATTHMFSDLSVAAMLGNAVFTALGGDITTTIFARIATNQRVMPVLFRTVANLMPGVHDRAMTDMLARGVIVNDKIANNFVAARMGAGQQYGPAITRRISDWTMRLSLMNRWTNSIRAANQQETMARMWKLRDMDLADVPERAIYIQQGITDAEWGKMRAYMATMPAPPRNGMFAPLSISPAWAMTWPPS